MAWRGCIKINTEEIIMKQYIYYFPEIDRLVDDEYSTYKFSGEQIIDFPFAENDYNIAATKIEYYEGHLVGEL
jgi:hypothetical protein